MTSTGLGIVVIGRNEGERLRRCLESLPRDGCACVYVDSGSSDGSPELARRMGCEVVELDSAMPFTAARGRNAGLQRLLDIAPATEAVQFVDGDCEMRDGWLDRGRNELARSPELAAVFGRVRERRPEASIYNQLCDMEWDVPIGEIRSCGGIAMMRVAALRQVGGFRGDMIAGEEPELCFRLRQGGWKIRRIEGEMVLHDAAMSRFGQWWKRAIRSGHAYAEGARLHGRKAERYFVREVFRIATWSTVVPLVAFSVGTLSRGLGLGLLLCYLFPLCRIVRSQMVQGRSLADSGTYAVFTTLSKWPEMWGMLTYCVSACRGGARQLIEYK